MSYLSYLDFERQLPDALPELRPAAAIYEKLEGPPGQDPGNYIFFESMFGAYVEVLLAMHESAGRDRLLARAFQFVEEMLKCPDSSIRDLAFIGLYENQNGWWHGRALPFTGPVARSELDRVMPEWLDWAETDAKPDTEREVIDIYGVRDSVLLELQNQGIRVLDVPGISAPRGWERFSKLEQARTHDNAVAFLSCCGTSRPYVICPVTEIQCTETALLDLARNLADKDVEPRESKLREKSQFSFFRIAVNERVWNMKIGTMDHARYRGELWIAERFVQQELAPDIRTILRGERDRLKPH